MVIFVSSAGVVCPCAKFSSISRTFIGDHLEKGDRYERAGTLYATAVNAVKA